MSQSPTRSENDPVLTASATQSLYAPWRMAYLEHLGDKEPGAGGDGAGTGSFFRDYWLAPQHDARNHVVVRTDAGMILLNAFPYANGHLLVALGEARSRLLDYTPAQRATLWSLTDLASELMELALNPHGINIGINQGAAAGAGVPQHLHVHLVPRWNGDTSFIASVARVRVIPSSLDQMASRYAAVWGTIRGKWKM